MKLPRDKKKKKAGAPESQSNHRARSLQPEGQGQSRASTSKASGSSLQDQQIGSSSIASANSTTSPYTTGEPAHSQEPDTLPSSHSPPARVGSVGGKHTWPGKTSSSSDKAASIVPEPLSATMSLSQRNRQPRGGQRTGTHDTETVALWNQIQEDLKRVQVFEKRSAELAQLIQEKEQHFKEKLPVEPSVAECDALSALYRENLRITEDIKALIEGPDSVMDRLAILNALRKSDEEDASMNMGGRPGRQGASQSSMGMDLDGTSDSPVASPGPRKPNNNRLNSQPPTSNTIPVVEVPEKEDRSETGSNNSKTKITFAVGEEVAFKPKQQPGQDAPDWIQGIVTKVIGEGKSRRYDVKDPYPSEGEVSQNYRSSASSMVPVPAVGTSLPDFDVGKEVLGLYPGSSCFYRAEVKAMRDDKVELLFEDDEVDTLRLVDRRYVLDYRVTKDGKK